MQFIIYSLYLFGAIIAEASIIPTDINNIVPLNISLLKTDKDLGQNPRDQTPISNRNRYALETKDNLDISLIPMSQNPSKGPQRDMEDISLLLMSKDPSLTPSKGPQREIEDISPLPMSKDPSLTPSKGPQRDIELLSVIGLKQEEIEGIVKICEGMDLETMKSDLYTCAIKTVTSFIACMHNDNMDIDGLKGPTQPVPFIKCLNEAISVFVKCLLSKPSSVTLDSVPKFAM